jgi:lysozyme
MNEDLVLSRAGANLVKHFESCQHKAGPDRYAAYKCPAGVVTIGWGTTRSIKMGMVWSLAQCNAAFTEDMRVYESSVKRLVKVRLTQWQYDALVSFCYNCGAGNLEKSTLLKKVNAKDFDGAALEFHKWCKAGGKKLAGLVRRRASEALLFQNIPDLDYDGRPDKVVTQPDDPMPHHINVPNGG